MRFVALVATVLPGSALAQRSPTRLTVRAENPLPIERRDETIAIAWSVVAPGIPEARPDRVRVVDAGGQEIVSQVLDADLDGRPDSVLFQTDFQPKEVKTFRVEATRAAAAAPRVHVRHDEPRDDIAWENDRVAFRTYGEGLKKTPAAMSSSGIDVWTKRTRELILEKWYEKERKQGSYHVDNGEGADFFDVGQTLGAGGTAVWRTDSLFRADNFKAWRLIANGPVRAVFELRYNPWDAAGLRVSETKRITIDAGHHVYRQESVFRAEGASEVPYAIGLVKRPGMVGSTSTAHPWAWLAGWGPVVPRAGGHGELGTAVLLPRDRVTDWKETSTHYLAVSRASSGQPVAHYVGAGWTASGDFPTPQQWWVDLDTFAQRLAAPVRLTVDSSRSR
jgi:pectinesterase